MTPAAPQRKSEAMGRPRPEGCQRTCSRQQQLDSWLAVHRGAVATHLPKSAQRHSLPEARKAETLVWQDCSDRCARRIAESMSLPAQRYIEASGQQLLRQFTDELRLHLASSAQQTSVTSAPAARLSPQQYSVQQGGLCDSPSVLGSILHYQHLSMLWQQRPGTKGHITVRGGATHLGTNWACCRLEELSLLIHQRHQSHRHLKSHGTQVCNGLPGLQRTCVPVAVGVRHAWPGAQQCWTAAGSAELRLGPP